MCAKIRELTRHLKNLREEDFIDVYISNKMGSRQAQLAIGGGLVAITTAYFLLRFFLTIF
jgi:hypothetical protein